MKLKLQSQSIKIANSTIDSEVVQAIN